MHSGCEPVFPTASQVPVPSAYPVSTQNKMQAIHHWDLLAEDISSRILDAVRNGNAGDTGIFHVDHGAATPFETAFRELLITHLVEDGLHVSENEGGNFRISFDVQVVTHMRKFIRTRAGVYSALAPGLYVKREIEPLGLGNRIAEIEKAAAGAMLNVDAGLLTIDLPGNEILITVSVLFEHEYFLRRRATYYIDDLEAWHYKPVRPGSPLKTRTVRYSVVNK